MQHLAPHILTSMSLTALSLNNGALVVSWSVMAPIETVWSGLTDRALQPRWLGIAIESDIRPGGRLIVDHGGGYLSLASVMGPPCCQEDGTTEVPPGPWST